MKKMTCKQLGGACEKVFESNTFEEMAELSKNHGMEMYQQQDEAHLTAMQAMQSTKAKHSKAREQGEADG